MKNNYGTAWGAALLVVAFIGSSGVSHAQQTPPTSSTPIQATPPSGDIKQDRQDLRQDRKDIRQDKRDLRQDRRERNADRRELRQDERSVPRLLHQTGP